MNSPRETNQPTVSSSFASPDEAGSVPRAEMPGRLTRLIRALWHDGIVASIARHDRFGLVMLLIGMVGTIFWVVIGWQYIGVGGASPLPIENLMPQEFGMLGLGLAGPVLAIWVGLGMAMFMRSVSMQLRILRAMIHSDQGQARAMRRQEQAGRNFTLIRLGDFYIHEMAKCAAVLTRDVLELQDEVVDRMWQRFADGDREIFFRSFFAETQDDLAEFLRQKLEHYPRTIRSAHLLAGHYQVFMTHCSDIDSGNLLIETYRKGFVGQLCRALNVALYQTESPFA